MLPRCLALLQALLASDEVMVDPDCPCRKSLELAVWTDPARLDPKRRRELAILFE